MRRLLTLSMTITLALIGTTAVASTARAAGLEIVCTASHTVSYNPPLASTAGNTMSTVSTERTPCVSTTQPAITSSPLKTVTFPITGRSCTDLLNPGSATQTVTWNTGQTSTVAVTYTTTMVGAVYSVITTGTVTAGVFQGGTWAATLTGPSTDITLCLLGLGTVASIQNIGTLTITS